MITFLDPLPVGNAVRCMFSPPADATAWKVLRKTSAVFSGHDDPDAVVVNDNGPKAFVDAKSLPNGVQHFYRPYYLIEAIWTAGANVSATPAMALEENGPDALELVRDRLEWGYKAEVDAGRLKHADGAIPTLSAPPVFEETQFPIVSVHLAGQRRFASAVGELLAPDVFDDADWIDSEGVLWSVSLTIVCWVVGNPDTRIALRKATEKLLLGNLPVFSDAGLSEVEFSMQDSEDFETYGAPVYQTVTTLTCLAPKAVQARHPAISDVTVAMAA